MIFVLKGEILLFICNIILLNTLKKSALPLFSYAPTAIPEDALNDESDDEDKVHPDQRISSEWY